MLRSFLSRVAGLFLLSVVFGASTASAQPVTVIEYYNKALDAHFITGKTPEQAALDAVAGFQRTGMTFQAVSSVTAAASLTKICRFYISSVSPYTSSHFYGRQGVDCESIRAQNLAAFTWEDYDFATQQPANGACAAGTVAIYRGFRQGANGKTSNHRYSASLSDYNFAIGTGYAGEGVAFCATAATATMPTVTPPPVSGSGDCGDYYTSTKRITMTNTQSQAGIASTFVRTYDSTPVIFLGKTASRAIDTSPDGGKSEIFLVDNGATITELGSRSTGGGTVSEVVWTPPIVYPKSVANGFVLTYTRAIEYTPVSSSGNGTQTGTITSIGRESVTVPAGTFNACKYTVRTVTEYPNIGSRSVTTATAWHAPGIGLLKFDATDSSIVFGFSVDSSYQLLATSIQ
jgi:hypothetical protein